ncbi:hypothetical protein Bca101_078289 [Brassica carinata]
MVMEENNLKFSARLVHSFLCKELVTSKRHEKWFTFARRPLRFGLQEYHAVTGLKVNQEKNSRLPALGIDRLHCGSIDLSAIELKRSTDVEQVDQDMVRNFLCVSADRDRPIL